MDREREGSEGMARTGRRPGSPATRDSILRAARTLFAERGYERTGLRVIAEAAGVHPALIHYHFGGKQQLYQEVLDLPFDPWEVLTRLLDETPRSELPEALLRQFLGNWRDPEIGSRLVAMLRHALAEEEGTNLTRAHLDAVVIPRFARALDVDQGDVAAAFAVLFGVVLADSFLRLEPLRDLTIDQLAAKVAPAIELLLHPAPTGGTDAEPVRPSP